MKKRLFSLFLAIVMVVGLLTGAVLSASAAGTGTLPGARTESNTYGDVFLGGNYMEIGISKHGSFGTSAEPTTAGWHYDAANATHEKVHGVGLLSDGDGWNVGEEPATGDFFLPGMEEERWILAYYIDNVKHEYAVADRRNTGSYRNWLQEPTVENKSDLTNGKLKAVVTGTTPEGVGIEITYSFGVDDLYYTTDVEITSPKDADIENVRFVRSFDPDQDAQTEYEYDTYNKVICNPVSDQPGGEDNYAMVVALGKETLSGFFFLAFDNRARAAWDDSLVPDNGAYDTVLWENAPKTEKTYATDEALEMSQTNRNGYTLYDGLIALTFNLGTMEQGTSTELQYLSSLNPDVEDSLNTITSGNVDDSSAGDFAGTTADGLDEIAEGLAEDYPNQDIEVKLIVTALEEADAPGADAIAEIAGGRNLAFVDLTLTAKIGDAEPVDIGADNTQLLKIVLPFDGEEKKDFAVYRYHDAATGAEALGQGSEHANSDGEYCEIGTDTITLYAMKFSTYAIGYKDVTQQVEVTIDEAPQTDTYDGGGKDFIIDGTPEDGFTVQYWVDGQWTAAAPSDAGVYDVWIIREADDDYFAYDKEIEGGLIIEPKEVGLAWSDFTDEELIYSGTAKTMTATATGLVPGDTCTVTVEVVGDNVNVGTFCYEAVALSNENYRLPDDVLSPSYTITPRTLTVIAEDKKVFAGHRLPVLTYTVTGFVGDETFITEPILTTNANIFIIGEYEIIPSGADAGDNYEIVYVNGTLTVKFNPTILLGGLGCICDPYTDVDQDAWYHDAVDYCLEKGLMNGLDETTFAPNGTMTRAMVWTVLGRMDGRTFRSTGEYWYTEAQNWAVTSGISDGTNPNGAITREELITMLWRFVGQPKAEENLLHWYNDGAAVSDWAADAMAWAVHAQIIEGTNYNLNPQDTALRAQVAAILMRYFG